jgi:NAD(P)-dependent dehydrogenase (short-subunit alcohol dehydrogenase family)
MTNVDVSSAESVKAMAEALKEPVDIVINNAGYFYGPQVAWHAGELGLSARGRALSILKSLMSGVFPLTDGSDLFLPAPIPSSSSA